MLTTEEWFRQGVIWYYLARGYAVLFDRHFFVDYFAHHIAGTTTYRPIAARLHGWMLDHVYPRPDLVILLDAPAEVLFGRKPEGTLEAVEHRRREYLDFQQHFKHFVIIDTSQAQDVVLSEVMRVLCEFTDCTLPGAMAHGRS
jgi:thymidylate kinase